MGNSYLLLGNGFSIDVIKKLNKDDQIDLVNLFSKGTNVCYPKTREKGFLSRKYTPNLWTLGARTYISNEESVQLITDIITCANVYNLSAERRPGEKDPSMYISAYSELSTYLRFLFIYYNNLITDEELKKISADIELLDYIISQIKKGKRVYVITYNYDVLLERLLTLMKISFDVYGFTDTGANVIIYKPHGSISFSFRIKVQESSPYSIRAAVEESIAQEAENFEIKYDLSEDYPIVNAIIPPAGDSTRLNLGWIKEIRQGIKEITNRSTSKDEIILFGISYWHVDRNEIDDILISIDSQMEVKYVNPAPPTSLDAVLSSLFANYIHYRKGALLKEEL